MASLFSFDHGPSQNDFPGSFDQILQEFTYLGSALAKSPEQLLLPLPDPDSPSFLRAQPSTVYSPAHEARYPAGFVVGLSNPMAHTSFDHYDRHPQPNLQRIPYLEPFFNPLDPGPLPTVAPTTQHSPATLGAGRPLVRGDLREYSSSVASGSSPIHDFSQYPSTYGQPPCNGSHMLVSQHESSHSAMRIPHSQMQPAPASVVQSPSPIPSDLALQPPPTRHPIRTSSFPIQSVSPKEMISPTFQWVRDAGIRAPSSRRNSRRSNSVISSPHRPTRTSSAPVQPASPKEMALHICQWVGDDGMPCRAQITRADLSQHLAIHGVKGKAGDHRLSCRWLGCQLRGDRHTIKRESILRHVLEIHMGYRRVSK